MTDSCRAVVSIQRATASNAVEGHLAWGALISPDLVLVPGPLDWLLDAEVPMEVLLARAMPRGPGLVERIRPAQVETCGLEADPRGAVAAFRLAYPSRHRPVGDAVDVRELQVKLADEPDVWAALEATGGVPAGIRDLPLVRVLEPVVAWEADIRRALVTVGAHRTAEDIALRFCKITRKCDCVGQWW